jgi:amino acid permease
MTKEKTMSPN